MGCQVTAGAAVVVECRRDGPLKGTYGTFLAARRCPSRVPLQPHRPASCSPPGTAAGGGPAGCEPAWRAPRAGGAGEAPSTRAAGFGRPAGDDRARGLRVARGRRDRRPPSARRRRADRCDARRRGLAGQPARRSAERAVRARPWVPAAIGTTTGLVCVAAVNPLFPTCTSRPARSSPWRSASSSRAARGTPRSSAPPSAACSSSARPRWRTSSPPRAATAGCRSSSSARRGGAGGRIAPRRSPMLEDLAAVVEAQQPDVIVLTDGIVRGRARAAARHDRPPLPRRGADELLRVRVRLRAARAPHADVVPQPAAPAPASRAAARPSGCSTSSSPPSACSSTAPLLPLLALLVKRTPGTAHLPPDARRRGRPALHDVQVPHDARDRRAAGRARVRPGQRSAASTGAGRFLRRTHLDELPAALERPRGRHVDRRAAPRAARVRLDARGRDPVLEPAPADEARHDRLGAGPLRLCVGLRQLGREALLRLLVHAPRQPRRRHRGLRPDVLLALELSEPTPAAVSAAGASASSDAAREVGAALRRSGMRAAARRQRRAAAAIAARPREAAGPGTLGARPPARRRRATACRGRGPGLQRARAPRRAGRAPAAADRARAGRTPARARSSTRTATASTPRDSGGRCCAPG